LNWSIAGLVLSYVALAMLLLSLNLASLWRWWIKATAIIVVTVFFGVSYRTIDGLLGWPTTRHLPIRFNLLSTHVAEPDQRTADPGHIYLWAADIDENNVPSGLPRSYQLAYSKALAKKIHEAQDKLDHGGEVMGVLSTDDAPADSKQARDNIKMGRMQKTNDRQSPAADRVPFEEDGSNVSFDDLPPVILPDKDPL
jgi:hypothetical protein